MINFATVSLLATPTTFAPDGSNVRELLALSAGSMAHFELGAGQVARAITHLSVDEIWFIVSGRGDLWRKQGDRYDRWHD